MQGLIREHLLRAQHRMKHQEDTNRSDRQFQVGDWAFLKLQPYVQQTVVRLSNYKLGFKYFGPYQITERVGEVAYRLALPETSKIHPVVHVSLLKPADQPTPTSDTMDSLFLLGDKLSKPAQILQTRLVRVGGHTRTQWKIAWRGLPITMATWEWSSAVTATTTAG